MNSYANLKNSHFSYVLYFTSNKFFVKFYWAILDYCERAMHFGFLAGKVLFQWRGTIWCPEPSHRSFANFKLNAQFKIIAAEKI